MANPRLGWVANKAIKRWKMYRRTQLRRSIGIMEFRASAGIA
jgi:hypothetical protein